MKIKTVEVILQFFCLRPLEEPKKSSRNLSIKIEIEFWVIQDFDR